MHAKGAALPALQGLLSHLTLQVLVTGPHATSKEQLLGSYYGTPAGGVTSLADAFQVRLALGVLAGRPSGTATEGHGGHVKHSHASAELWLSIARPMMHPSRQGC